MKTTAKTIVKNVPIIALFLSPWISAWWPQVIKAPLDNNKKVFSNGIAKGSNAEIPWGGQLEPISIAGDKLEWKKAQKTLKNAKTSLMINRIKPIINPFYTSKVWQPK